MASTMAMSTISEHLVPSAQICRVRVRNIATLNSESDDDDDDDDDDDGDVTVIYRCSCLIGQSICCCSISARISQTPQPQSATYRRYLPTPT